MSVAPCYTCSGQNSGGSPPQQMFHLLRPGLRKEPVTTDVPPAQARTQKGARHNRCSVCSGQDSGRSASQHMFHLLRRGLRKERPGADVRTVYGGVAGQRPPGRVLTLSRRQERPPPASTPGYSSSLPPIILGPPIHSRPLLPLYSDTGLGPPFLPQILPLPFSECPPPSPTVTRTRTVARVWMELGEK